MLSGELSALRHTVTRKLEPQVERLAKAGAGGGPDGGGGGGGSVDIPALKEALRDWVDELVCPPPLACWVSSVWRCRRSGNHRVGTGTSQPQGLPTRSG